MNISKEKFKELAKEHLIALESYKMDKKGNKPIEIFGIEKLYEAINVIHSSKKLKNVKSLLTFSKWLLENGYKPYNKDSYQKENELHDRIILEVRYKNYIKDFLIV